MTNPEESIHPTFSADRWIELNYVSRQLDGAVSENFNPFDTVMKSVIEGSTPSEQLTAEFQTDPGVETKNRFLGLLAELSDDGQNHVNDLLALLDRQAGISPDANETRYRQFMGLWDLVVALSNDEDLLDRLRTLPDPKIDRS